MEKSSPTSRFPQSGHSTSSSASATGSNSSAGLHHPPPPQSPRPIPSPSPTTFVQAHPSSFKQVVQLLTGSPKPAAGTPPPPPPPPATAAQPDPIHPIHPKPHHNSLPPPIKSIPVKRSSGFKLYERRNSLRSLKINPLNSLLPGPGFGFGSGFSPRKPEILSPSILDFPALALSPVTPLLPDPFNRPGSGLSTPSPMETEEAAAEEKAIKEKGFYFRRSPATTPRESEPPRLLPLFPVTSPRVSNASS